MPENTVYNVLDLAAAFQRGQIPRGTIEHAQCAAFFRLDEPIRHLAFQCNQLKRHINASRTEDAHPVALQSDLVEFARNQAVYPYHTEEEMKEAALRVASVKLKNGVAFPVLADSSGMYLLFRDTPLMCLAVYQPS